MPNNFEKPTTFEVSDEEKENLKKGSEDLAKVTGNPRGNPVRTAMTINLSTPGTEAYDRVNQDVQLLEKAIGFYLGEQELADNKAMWEAVRQQTEQAQTMQEQLAAKEKMTAAFREDIQQLSKLEGVLKSTEGSNEDLAKFCHEWITYTSASLPKQENYIQ